MKDISLDEVFAMDDLLIRLATYEVMGGKIVMPTSIEGVLDLQKKVATKFNYFKWLIQSGECTMDFIKGQVLKKNGPYLREQPIGPDSPNFMDKIMGKDEPKMSEKEARDKFIKNVLKLFAPEMNENQKNEMIKKIGSVTPPKNPKKKRNTKK